MSRGWKVTLGVVAGVVALNLLLELVRQTTGGTPGGPASSSYATAPEGVAAYASLLERAGHSVVRARSFPAAATLDPHETVVVLDPPLVVPEDGRALRSFLEAGGRLVASDDGTGWLRRVLRDAPVRRDSAPRQAGVLAPAPELAGVRRVTTAGDGSWTQLGSALPLLGGSGSVLLADEQVGRGRALLLADSSLLQNRFLGQADDGGVALALAGPARRPVVFLEAYHGYGSGTGLGAIPGRWRDAFVLALLAVGVFVLSRIRRFGPPEPGGAVAAPPRREYVEALAGTLARTRDRTEALAPLRRELRRRIEVRTGLAPGSNDAAVAVAAARLGLAEDEVRRALDPETPGRNELELGRLFARTTPRERQRWMS